MPGNPASRAICCHRVMVAPASGSSVGTIRCFVNHTTSTLGCTTLPNSNELKIYEGLYCPGG